MQPLRPEQIEQVRTLLQRCALPVDDVDTSLLGGFVGVFDGDELIALGGLEVHGKDALIRSVATDIRRRGEGLASRIVAALEEKARGDGIGQLYLLTETAEGFFARAGYKIIDRKLAPPAIAATAQFAHICPGSASFMAKSLA